MESFLTLLIITSSITALIYIRSSCTSDLNQWSILTQYGTLPIFIFFLYWSSYNFDSISAFIEFNNSTFNIVELEKEVVRKAKVILDEKNIKVEFKEKENINVYADDFYIEQVITNYLTNAIKHTKEVAGEKYIKIENEIDKNKNKVIVRVFNTGDIISEENKTRIWNRFYKIDESRNRDDGGTGIGLALVRAIMNNYNSEYGVENKVNGVEFYFELDLSDTEK